MPPGELQVEVEKPPGLEAKAHDVVGGVVQEAKEQLIREVTEVVREHIEWKTAAAVDALWHKGQRAMQYLHQQQISQTEQLQGQLAACAESYRNLERENARLRSGLEALMKHLTLLFGPPPTAAAPPHAPAATALSTPAPIRPIKLPSAASLQEVQKSVAAFERESSSESTDVPSARSQPAQAGSMATPAGGAAATCAAPGVAAGAMTAPATADATAPAAAPVAAGLPSPPDTPPPAAPAEAPGAAIAPATAQHTFSLTLRRADHVPLGVEVKGEGDDPHLTVESITANGAAEAWNRQCAGDNREIRPGDRIVAINGAQDAAAMRRQFNEQRLLRLTVQREDATHPARSMRADAEEFVPKVEV